MAKPKKARKCARPSAPYRRLEISVGVFGFVLGQLLVAYREDVRHALGGVSSWVDLPSVVVGMAGGLFFYLWRVTEGAPFRCMTAALHTFVGSFFGYLGGKVAAGAGANEHIQTVAAGLAGGSGPKALQDLEIRRGK